MQNVARKSQLFSHSHDIHALDLLLIVRTPGLKGSVKLRSRGCELGKFFGHELAKMCSGDKPIFGGRPVAMVGSPVNCTIGQNARGQRVGRACNFAVVARVRIIGQDGLKMRQFARASVYIKFPTSLFPSSPSFLPFLLAHSFSILPKSGKEDRPSSGREIKREKERFGPPGLTYLLLCPMLAGENVARVAGLGRRRCWLSARGCGCRRRCGTRRSRRRRGCR